MRMAVLPGINAFKGFFELGNAAGEILIEVEIEIVVEVDDESFILGLLAWTRVMAASLTRGACRACCRYCRSPAPCLRARPRV